MKKLLLCAGLVAVSMMTGCIVINKPDGGSVIAKPTIVPDAYREVFEEGKDPVTAEESVSVLFGFITWGATATHVADQGPSLFSFLSSSGRARDGAFAKACEAANADTILAARYIVTTEDYFVFKKVTARITGIPAKMTGLEKLPSPVCPCCNSK